MTKQRSEVEVQPVMSLAAVMSALHGLPVVTPEAVQKWLEEAARGDVPFGTAAKLADVIVELARVVAMHPEKPGLFPESDSKPVAEALWALNRGLPKLLDHFQTVSEALPPHRAGELTATFKLLFDLYRQVNQTLQLLDFRQHRPKEGRPREEWHAWAWYLQPHIEVALRESGLRRVGFSNATGAGTKVLRSIFGWMGLKHNEEAIAKAMRGRPTGKN